MNAQQDRVRGKNSPPPMDSILSWNVRGMNAPNKQEDIYLFLQRHRVGLIGFLETKVQNSKIDDVMHRVCPNWTWIHNATTEERGRIILSWHPRKYRVKIIHINDQIIHGEATHLPTGRSFFISYIYGRNLVEQRLPLWESLRSISNSIDDPWCVMGDFNSILNLEDRIGGTTVTENETRDFADCILYCGLQEFSFEGAYYTWNNKRIWSKIDRAFHNNLWYAQLDFTHVHFLSQGLSDHSPILVSFPKCPKPMHPFQFCDMWAKDKDFKGLVRSVLSQPQKRSHLGHLQQVLTRLVYPLKQLSRSRYADIYEQQQKARDNLTQIQHLLHMDPTNQALLIQEQQSREHYVAINHSAMLLIKQQCKADWIGQGDECSRLFMAKIKERKALTCIYHIEDCNGQKLEGFQEVSKVLTSYYKNMLGSKDAHRTPIDMQIIDKGNTLNVEQQLNLCKPFDNNDIKQVLFSIPSHKSPGPDGFNSGFFQSCWDDIGPLVCNAIQEFFERGLLPSFYGKTKIILLPKVPNPVKPSDFRPISCCNIIYKCITKLLCTRLKEVLPHLIDAGQGAFVKGRELLFNVLICQDIVRGYQRLHTPPCCVMKVDLHKAFDSIHWDFVQEMLLALKFPPLFVKWTMNCISQVQFAINVNGQQGDWFRGKRGLKQGDPLSPLLFVMSMDYLSRLFKHASSQPGFGYHPHCKKMALTHLMFADDLIIFCKAEPTSIQLLMNAFNTFTRSTGLKANLDKSSMIFGGNCSHIQQTCLDITGFKEGHLPFRYLGLPITSSRMSKAECSTLVTKITARIRIWASRHMSYAGRLVLVNSVLFGMFSFWAQVFILPHAVLSKVSQLCRNFLWGGDAEYKKTPLIAWDTACTPRKLGGLGIKNLNLWNNACIAKLVWAVAKKKDLLWIQWVHGRYIRGMDWWMYTPKGDASWYWKKIHKIKQLFCNYSKDEYKVNEGYRWLLNSDCRPYWTTMVWSRISIPRHSITAWFFMHQRLPVLSRLGQHMDISTICSFCQHHIETQDHLFFECPFAKELWDKFTAEWSLNLDARGREALILSLKRMKLTRKMRNLIHAMSNAMIYHIWQARNMLLFKNETYQATSILRDIKTHVIQRVLQIHQCNHSYTSCIDFLLRR